MGGSALAHLAFDRGWTATQNHAHPETARCVIGEQCVVFGAPVAQRMARAGADEQRRLLIRYQALCIIARLRGNWDVPFEPALGDAERFAESPEALEHVLTLTRPDAAVGEQPLKIP